MPENPTHYQRALRRLLSSRTRSRIVQIGASSASVSQQLAEIAIAYSAVTRVMLVSADPASERPNREGMTEHPRLTIARAAVGPQGISLIQVLAAEGWSHDPIDILQLNTEDDDATLAACVPGITRPRIISYSHGHLSERRRLAIEVDLHRRGYHLHPWNESETLASRSP